MTDTTDTSAILTFTEVPDGKGSPASYDVRYAVAPLAWGSARSVQRGTCQVPMAGTSVGATRSCTVLGLVARTAYQFQLVAFRGTLNVDAVFGSLSNVVGATTPASTDTLPRTVTDLLVADTTDSAVTLSFTEVSDGTGSPASYDVRYALAPLSWGSATSVGRGTCQIPMAGTTIGAKRSCTVLGLGTGTTYQFQLVAFRGTLNANATFGGLSNVVSATTRVSAPPPPPPSPPPPPPPGGNEPPGMTLINEQPWNCLSCNGWNYRADYGWSDIQTDPAAPKSPSSVLRAVFPTTMPRDHGPSNQWIFIGNQHDWHELYVSYWIKWGDPWDARDQGAKISFVWARSGSYIYAVQVAGSAPYHIGMVVGWSPYGYSYGDGGVWHPNVATTPIVTGQWYFVEEYFKYPTTPGGSDGVMKWWVNGTLNGDFRNVIYPDDDGFEQFEFPFTRQATPQAQSYVYVDNTRLSGRQ